MKKQLTRGAAVMSLAATLIFGFMLVCSQTSDNVKAQTGQTPDTQTTTSQSDKPFDQAQALADLRKAIAGQEDKPAGEVFKNIQMFKSNAGRASLKSNGVGIREVFGCQLHSLPCRRPVGERRQTNEANSARYGGDGWQTLTTSS